MKERSWKSTVQKNYLSNFGSIQANDNGRGTLEDLIVMHLMWLREAVDMFTLLFSLYGEGMDFILFSTTERDKFIDVCTC